jgi:hypothetical protein
MTHALLLFILPAVDWQEFSAVTEVSGMNDEQASRLDEVLMSDLDRELLEMRKKRALNNPIRRIAEEYRKKGQTNLFAILIHRRARRRSKKL